MSDNSRLPILKVVKFKPSPYSVRRKMLNLADFLDEASDELMFELEDSIKVDKIDVRKELKRYKSSLNSEASFLSNKSISPALLLPKLPKKHHKTNKVMKSLEHKRSRSLLPQASPLAKKITPNRLRIREGEADERDEVEEFFDNLIKNRETLHNPLDISSLRKSRKLPHKVKADSVHIEKVKNSTVKSAKNAASPANKMHTIISKQEVNYETLANVEGEDRLKKKILHFRKEITRLLNKVEEFVIAV
mmetsp:Transcript_13188/g.24687  ORF Transcript_13188/g.24687 Transcript_13188/m.24687 type:complete len:248 (+) Transcript_13188:135-878(+)